MKNSKKVILVLGLIIGGGVSNSTWAMEQQCNLPMSSVAEIERLNQLIYDAFWQKNGLGDKLKKIELRQARVMPQIDVTNILNAMDNIPSHNFLGEKPFARLRNLETLLYWLKIFTEAVQRDAENRPGDPAHPVYSEAYLAIIDILPMLQQFYALAKECYEQ